MRLTFHDLQSKKSEEKMHYACRWEQMPIAIVNMVISFNERLHVLLFSSNHVQTADQWNQFSEQSLMEMYNTNIKCN